MISLRWMVTLGTLAALAGTATAKKQAPPPEPAAPVAEAPAAEAPEADADANEDAPPHQVGPMTVALGRGVEIVLPEGMWLIEEATARTMLEAAGENTEGVLGMVYRPSAGSTWSITIYDDPVGHVSDHDAGELDAASLLASMKEGTLEQNKMRVAKGITPLYVDAFAEPPAYDPARRVLSWTLELHDADGPLVNAFTNVLGRHGYVAVNLITPPADLEANRRDASAVIAGIRFQPGHRYEDFDPATDKDSGLGLRELVVGGGILAAVKAGKLGVIAKILIALKKFFIVIGVAIAGFFKAIHRWLTGRRTTAAAADSSSSDG